MPTKKYLEVRQDSIGSFWSHLAKSWPFDCHAVGSQNAALSRDRTRSGDVVPRYHAHHHTSALRCADGFLHVTAEGVDDANNAVQAKPRVVRHIGPPVCRQLLQILIILKRQSKKT